MAARLEKSAKRALYFPTVSPLAPSALGTIVRSPSLGFVVGELSSTTLLVVHHRRVWALIVYRAKHLALALCTL